MGLIRYLKVGFVKGQIFGFAALILLFSEAVLAETVCDQHLVVAYASNASVLGLKNRVTLANDFLRHLITQGLGRDGTSSEVEIVLNRLPGEKQRTLPGNCFSLVRIGMERAAMEKDLIRLREPDFWPAFTGALVHWDTTAETTVDRKQAERVANWIDSNATREAYPYALSLYALPALLSSLPDIYAQHLYVLSVSDVAYEKDGLRTYDRAIAEIHLGSRTEVLERANAAMLKHFRLNHELFHARVGGFSGIQIQLIEISAPGQGSLNVGEQPQFSEKRRGEWEVHWPRVTASTGGMPQSDFDFGLGWMALRAPGATASVPLGALNDFGKTLHIEAGAAAVRSSFPHERGPETTFYWKVRYAPEREFNMTLPMIWSSSPAAASLVALPVAPWITISFLACVGLAVWLVAREVLRRPTIDDLNFSADERKVAPDMSGSTDAKVIGENNHEYHRVLWSAASSVHVAWTLQNKSKNSRPMMLKGRIEAGQRDDALDTAVLRLPVIGGAQPERSPDDFEVELSGGQSAHLEVWLDIKDTVEPKWPKFFDIGFKLVVQDSYENVRTIDSGFRIEENPGPLWVALDPGTSGSCVALGAGPGSLRLVPLQDGNDLEASSVMPSVVYICKDSQESRQERAETYSKDGFHVGYLCGHPASAYAKFPERCYYSPKRLVGYQETRDLLYDGKNLKLQGHDAVKMIVQFLLKKAIEENGRSPNPRKINKAVVAVPNMFTPARVQRMLHLCRVAGIERVDHIYEAEATLMHYYANSNRLVPEPREERIKNREAKGEGILVVDFGGSSLNLTYAHLESGQDGSSVEAHIVQRLGYAIGGDRLDWEIAEVLWEHANQNVDSLPSLLSDPRTLHFVADDHRSRWIDRRSEFLNNAERVKKQCSERWAKHAKSVEWDPLNATKTKWSKEKLLSSEHIIESPGVKAISAMAAEGVREIVTLTEGRKQWKGVDTVLLSGRSVRFAGFRESIKEAVKTTISESAEKREAAYVDLEEEGKICVASGAAIWASRQENIKIIRDGTFAHYGAVQFNSGGGWKWLSLITPGQELLITQGQEIDKRFKGKQENIAFQNNGGVLPIYQVMSSAPAATVLEPAERHRFSLLCEMDVPLSGTVPVQALELSLFLDDTFGAQAYCGGQVYRAEGGVDVKELLEDQDKSARLLALPPIVARDAK